jgi:hypothetical protein
MLDFECPEPTHLCANADCHEREWHLEPLTRELWRLRSDERAFTLAASQPACPACGSPLLEIAALEPDLGSAAVTSVPTHPSRRAP